MINFEKLFYLWTDKLNILFIQALPYLGVNPTAEQIAEMRRRLNIDAAGTVNYGGMNRSKTYKHLQ